MSSSSWIVHKFGGTSLASAARYKSAAQILLERDESPCAVVVSAMGGMTDALVELVTLATSQTSYEAKLSLLQGRLSGTLYELLRSSTAGALMTTFSVDLGHIQELLRACWLLRSHSTQVMDVVSGYGELWSAQMLRAHLLELGVKAHWMDAREVIVVEPGAERAPALRMETSQQNLDGWLERERGDAEVLVITGFIASSPQGLPTTLGRNGSDYSAAIFSALFRAPELLIWTDVDGVMSANPRLVPEAIVLDALSYEEAMELAYFGAKVLHPSTIAPAVARDVEIVIKNTFAPHVPGTRIGKSGSSAFAIKGFTTVDDVALVNLEGSHMIGVPGIASRLFGALRDAQISVIMISQASSEHSICFAVPAIHAEKVREVVERAFFAERHQGQLQTLQIQAPCSILAAVGDQMTGQVGIAGRFMTALANARINIRAIAQGSSERNISVIIDQRDAQRALRAVHSSFTLSHKTLSIGLVGAGSVGETLLAQLEAQAQVLREEFNIDLRVRAVATSARMLLDEVAADLSTWKTRLHEDGVPADLDALAAHVQAEHLPHAVIIDCTADAGVAARYNDWLARGIHVITPNKKANTADMASYKALRAHRHRKRHYFYETTVGAGLPIIHTVRELLQTGDAITRIEGILSGTLSYLFNMYDGTQPFSEIVAQARALGYTEPDPRDDLSGMDVARKVVILGREMGLELGLEDIALEGLVPPSLQGLDVQAYMDNLHTHDEAMRALHEAAHKRGEVLRFVGEVSATGASVGLRAFPASHPFARIQLTDNIVQFTTRRYAQNPLVVQGPGAGPEVTAGGIFGDILRLTHALGTT